MNADIITDLHYPHGTVEGFQNGCTTNHCPADVTCKTYYTRINGDYAFRRQIESGMTAIEIVTLERKQAQEAAHAAQEAEKAERARRSTETREAARERHNATRRANRAANLIPQKQLIPRHQLQELLKRGLTDNQIGEHLGYTRRQVAGARNSAGLERNPDTRRRVQAGAES